MTKTRKKIYVAPSLTIVRFKTEYGYAISGKIEALRLCLDEGSNEGPYKPMEDYSVQDNWQSGGDFWN